MIATRVARLLTAGLLIALALPAVDAEGPDCANGSHATIANVGAGSLTFYSQLGTQNFVIPFRLTQIAFAGSTTGTIQIQVAYECIESYQLVVEQVSGTGAGVVYNAFESKGCASGADSHNVPIDLNAGNYAVHLYWHGCDGTAGEEHRELVVCDPPLPIPRIGRLA